MPKNKKYQIFISSTYEDLKDERDAVLKAILKMKHFPIGMEMFNAGNDQQWKIIQDTIDASDYYILILGQRYGSILDSGKEKGISYTEREYRYAVSKDIPVIAFILDDNADITIKDVERDKTKADRLLLFKKNVTGHHMVEWFKTPEELAAKVTNALYQEFDQTERPGWVRSDSGEAEKVASEIAELSRKNRMLEAENQELKQEVSKRVPELSLNLTIDTPDDDEEDDKKHKELFKSSPQVTINGTGLDIKIKKVCPIDYSDRYEPLEYDDQAKALGVTEEEITEYNDQLPSADKIKEINQYSTCLKDIRQNGVAFSINVNNTGTTKATDVRVRMTSEDEKLFFYELDKVEEFDKLELPKLPENPIEKAEERRQKRLLGFGAIGDTWESLQKLSKFDSISPVIDSMKPIIPSISSPHETVTVKDHSIAIDADQVLHPTGENYRRFYMIPSEPGNFVLKCKIMCTEFIELIEQDITVNVIEEDDAADPENQRDS